MIPSEVNYCPRCGTPATWGFHYGRERPACPACGWIFFADPKVAVAVVLLRDQSVLLVQRLYNPHKGSWTLPAGFVDAGEDPQDAARRECLEETGLQVKVGRLLGIISGQEHERGAHILIVYQGEIVSGELVAGDDASGAAFFRLDDLPLLAFQSTKLILSPEYLTKID